MTWRNRSLGRAVLRAGAVVSLAAAVLGTGRAEAQEEFGPNLGIIGVTAEIQDLANSGAGVTVGIIDGLADALHFDLSIALQILADGGSYLFADPHGTHVAGIVAAQLNGSGTVGVAPGATIVSLGAFDDFGWAGPSTGDWLGALQIQGGNIANMSYGPITRGDLVFEDEIYDFANYPGILLVRAAGNDGRNLINETCFSNPTVCAEASTTLAHLIIVGALDASGTAIAFYSNTPGEGCFKEPGGRRSSCTESNKFKYFFIVAPGTSVVSTVPGDGYASFSGTSMAAPHVAGAAALVMSMHPHLIGDPASVAQILFLSADDLGATGVDGVYGWGRLNVAAALQPIGDPVIPPDPVIDPPPPPRGDRPPRQPRGPRAASSALALGPALSADIAKDFAGRSIAVFDMFGRDFLTPLSAFVTTVGRDADSRTILSAFGREPITLENRLDATMRLVMFDNTTLLRDEDAAPAFALVARQANGLSAVGANLGAARFIDATGLRPIASGGIDVPGAIGASHLGLVGQAFSAAYGSVAGPVSWSASLFTGNGEKAADGAARADTSGMELATGFAPFDGAYLGIQAGYVRETGGILGSVGSGYFGLTDTGTSYAGLSAKAQVSSRLTVGASAEIGFAETRRETYGGTGGSDLISDAFALWAEMPSVIGEGDRLKLQVSQPLRVESGTLNFKIPIGRTIDGLVLWDSFNSNAAPDGREVRFDLSYATRVFDGWGDMHLGVVQRIDADHIAGNYETLGLMRLNRTF